MNLLELKSRVDDAIETAKDNEASPEDIQVTLQIDGPSTESVWSDYEVELHYDNDFQTSGCVIVAYLEE